LSEEESSALHSKSLDSLGDEGSNPSLSVRLDQFSRHAGALRAIRYPGAKAVLNEIEKIAQRYAVEETQTAGEIDRIQKELGEFDSEETKRIRRSAESTHFAIRQFEMHLD